MSRKLKVSAKAETDLLKIGRFTEQKWGKTQRNHYLKQIDEAFSLIAENPEIGKNRSHVLPGYRGYQQGAQVIFYRQDEAIEIIRVVHKRMDVARHFRQA